MAVGGGGIRQGRAEHSSGTCVSPPFQVCPWLPKLPGLWAFVGGVPEPLVATVSVDITPHSSFCVTVMMVH